MCKDLQRMLAVLIITLLWATCLLAQGPAIIWTRVYGGTNWDEGLSVEQTTDGGHIVVGVTSSLGAGRDDVYLLKLDADGDTAWTRTYGGTGLDWGESVEQTPDGGYILAGGTYSYGAGVCDVYLVRTNANGDTVWTRTYGGMYADVGNSVRHTADGGFILTGWTDSFGAGSSDVYLIRTDASGNLLWARTYGGTGVEAGNSVQLTADGGYIIAGQTSSFGTVPGDVYLIKTDANGDSAWARTYGGMASKDYGRWVQQTFDGGYIVAGGTCASSGDDKDVYLVRTNADGDTLWTRMHGGTNGDVANSVVQTTDSSFVVVGWTTSFGAGLSDIYMFKADANGDILWTETYGGAGYDWGHSVRQTTDLGFVIAGGTDSFGAGGLDAYIIKTGPNPGLMASVDTDVIPHTVSIRLGSASPNPFSTSASFSLFLPSASAVDIDVYDVAGRVVKAVHSGSLPAGSHSVEWDGKDKTGKRVAPGLYYLTVRSQGEVLSSTAVLQR